MVGGKTLKTRRRRECGFTNGRSFFRVRMETVHEQIRGEKDREREREGKRERAR